MQQAAARFEQKQYEESLRLYEAAFAQHHYSEQSLYRLAFLHEQGGNFPQTIFYLRTLEKHFRPEAVPPKIRQLTSKFGLRGISHGRSEPFFFYFIRTYLFWGAGIALGCVLLSLLILRTWKGPLNRFTRISLSLLALAICGALVFGHLFQSPQAVLIYPTQSYARPAYGAEKVPAPFAPGLTVTIVDSYDLWRRIRVGRHEAWVPDFVLKEI
ncbi:MAG: hypothetical protein AAGI38_21105 [Bacteroidota bacterium]